MSHAPSSLEEQEPPKQTHAAKIESDPFHAFLKKIEVTPSEEEKLRLSIDFMRSSLSQNSGSPYFKGFWEVRKLCLPLFKESITSSLRQQMWEEYVELTREGRRLKSMLDEEAAFAVEQIEIAVKSIEEEVEIFHSNSPEALAKFPSIDMPENVKAISGKYAYYQNIQQRLMLLNTYAARVHGLRKELIKTEMRIRNKNKFFERLSVLGDRIFPLRKDLIKEVSQSFMEDIASFVEEHFSEKAFVYEEVRRHVFFFRDEIKALQYFAKILTLNTQAFTTTREQLSMCWDKLKGMEKEIKREYSQQRQQASENALSIQEKIKTIADAYQEKRLSAQDAIKEYDALLCAMRTVDLTHYDVRCLKEELKVARDVPSNQLRADEDLKKQQSLAVEEKKRAQVIEFRNRVELLKETSPKFEASILSAELAKCREELAALAIPKREKHSLERSLKEIRDFLENKKEEALINLSDDDRVALENLRGILRQRNERRQEIKAQIEEYRKIVGGSTLDFEKAIEFGELMASEKERLEKMDESIREVEEKISHLKNR